MFSFRYPNTCITHIVLCQLSPCKEIAANGGKKKAFRDRETKTQLLYIHQTQAT